MMRDESAKRINLAPVAAVAVVLLLAAVLFSVRIQTVTVTGNERYTDEQIENIIFPDNFSRVPLLCYLKNTFRPHEKIPFVEDYKLAFQSPVSVEIIVYEKSVVGYVSYMSSYMYFDKDGIIVESDNEKLPGVPWITGLNFGQIVLYQPLPVERDDIFQEILNLTQILSIYELKVDRIQYDASGEATLYMGDIEVILGGNESLNGKIAELGDMLPMLEGRKGTLHLEDYKENGNTAGYAFKPKK
jgi:cell division protein FtsQ